MELKTEFKRMQEIENEKYQETIRNHEKSLKDLRESQKNFKDAIK